MKAEAATGERTTWVSVADAAVASTKYQNGQLPRLAAAEVALGHCGCWSRTTQHSSEEPLGSVKRTTTEEQLTEQVRESRVEERRRASSSSSAARSPRRDCYGCWAHSARRCDTAADVATRAAAAAAGRWSSSVGASPARQRQTQRRAWCRQESAAKRWQRAPVPRHSGQWGEGRMATCAV